MVSVDELNQAQFFEGDLDLETAMIDDIQYVRERDGTWRYAANWIKVPGARDLTLTEHIQPKFIVSGGEVERVVISARDIEEAPDLLEWCLLEGTPIKDGDGAVIEVFVPIQAWSERDRVPGALVAPEHSSDENERELAEAEREYREADRALEIAANNRAEVLRRHAESMTRQEARAITDLSIGRIQQLIRSDSLDELDMTLLEIVATRQPETVKQVQQRCADADLLIPLTALKQRLRELEKRELIIVVSDGFRLTGEGHEALIELKSRAVQEPEVEAS